MALIVAAAVLVVGAVVSLGTVAWGLSSFRVITDSEPLPGAMRSVVVDTGDTPIAVGSRPTARYASPVPTCAW